MAELQRLFKQAFKYLQDNLWFMVLVGASTVYYYLHSDKAITRTNNLAHWAFVEVAQMVERGLKSPLTVVSALLFGVALQTAIGLYLAYGLRRIYVGKGLRTSFRSRMSDYLFLLGSTLLVDLCFGLIAFGCYVPALNSWRTKAIDSSVMLLAFFIILFPLYYLLLSVTAFVSILPVSNLIRLQVIRKVWAIRKLGLLYGFYFLRVWLEAIALLMGPYLVEITRSPSLGIALTLAVLLWPLSYVRTLSFQVRLRVFEDDPVVYSTFASYYANWRPTLESDVDAGKI